VRGLSGNPPAADEQAAKQRAGGKAERAKLERAKLERENARLPKKPAPTEAALEMAGKWHALVAMLSDRLVRGERATELRDEAREQREPPIGLQTACRLTGINRSTPCRRRAPKTERIESVRPSPPNALLAEERDVLIRAHQHRGPGHVGAPGGGGVAGPRRPRWTGRCGPVAGEGAACPGPARGEEETPPARSWPERWAVVGHHETGQAGSSTGT
jgi:hypothetical protein